MTIPTGWGDLGPDWPHAPEPTLCAVGMTDTQVYKCVHDLVAEERELSQAASRGLCQGDAEVRRRHLETALDLCWNLLHQRQVRRLAD